MKRTKLTALITAAALVTAIAPPAVVSAGTSDMYKMLLERLNTTPAPTSSPTPTPTAAVTVTETTTDVAPVPAVTPSTSLADSVKKDTVVTESEVTVTPETVSGSGSTTSTTTVETEITSDVTPTAGATPSGSLIEKFPTDTVVTDSEVTVTNGTVSGSNSTTSTTTVETETTSDVTPTAGATPSGSLIEKFPTDTVVTDSEVTVTNGAVSGSSSTTSTTTVETETTSDVTPTAGATPSGSLIEKFPTDTVVTESELTVTPETVTGSGSSTSTTTVETETTFDITPTAAATPSSLADSITADVVINEEEISIIPVAPSSDNDTSETAEPTATAEVEETAEPTATAEATQTPEPTETPEPTVTPTPEPVVSYDDVIFSGNGTQSSPYKISTASELRDLAEKVDRGTTFEGKYIVLANDIDLSGEQFEPIGSYNSYYTSSFAGNFDGNGYVIFNLNVSSSESTAGLFASTNGAVISNLAVRGTVKGSDNAGGIVGYAYNTIIENCVNEADITTTDTNAGGIAGMIIESTVTGSLNLGVITTAIGAGGIVGTIADNGTVEDSVNAGIIDCDEYAGGIAGALLNGTIDGCISTGGFANGYSLYTGGISGCKDGTITSSYYDASISDPAGASEGTNYSGVGSAETAKLISRYEKSSTMSTVYGYPIPKGLVEMFAEQSRAAASYITLETGDCLDNLTESAIVSALSGAEWSSSNTSAVTIKNGVISRAANGISIVTAQYGDAKRYFRIDTTDKTYTISYDLNGGTSGLPDDQIKEFGTGLLLSSTVPKYTGYTFSGWNTKADGTGKSYAKSAYVTANYDITLYAQWEDTSATATPNPTATATPSHYYYYYGTSSGFSSPTSGTAGTGSVTHYTTTATTSTGGTLADVLLSLFAQGTTTTTDTTTTTTTASYQVFSDVTDDKWYATYVNNFASKGIVNGIGNGLFNPEGTVTKAEFITILGRRSCVDSTTTGEYYEPYMAWAVWAGIITDDENNPYEVCTRESIAKILAGWYKYAGWYTEPTITLTYSDTATISATCRDAVAFCTEMGLFEGRTNNCFDPYAYMTRAELVTLLTRAGF